VLQHLDPVLGWPDMRELMIDVEPRLHPRTSIVRPTGLLTQTNRHQLRTAVLTCLAECPAAVVIDAAELELIDGIAGAVFTALGREAAAGPGINVLLCRLDGLLARSLMALDPWQPHYSTVAQAVNTIDRGPAVRNWIYRQLPPGPEAESHSGCLVTSCGTSCTACYATRIAAPRRNCTSPCRSAAPDCSSACEAGSPGTDPSAPQS
jgi:hypothetical protein